MTKLMSHTVWVCEENFLGHSFSFLLEWLFGGGKEMRGHCETFYDILESSLSFSNIYRIKCSPFCSF